MFCSLQVPLSARCTQWELSSPQVASSSNEGPTYFLSRSNWSVKVSEPVARGSVSAWMHWPPLAFRCVRSHCASRAATPLHSAPLRGGVLHPCWRSGHCPVRPCLGEVRWAGVRAAPRVLVLSVVRSLGGGLSVAASLYALVVWTHRLDLNAIRPHLIRVAPSTVGLVFFRSLALPLQVCLRFAGSRNWSPP